MELPVMIPDYRLSIKDDLFFHREEKFPRINEILIENSIGALSNLQNLGNKTLIHA